MATRPEDLGLASERLARIDAHLKNRYLDPGKIAGALTLVSRHGEIAYLSPVGLADRERGKPMAEDTIFRIYSMSKPVTSVALMMLDPGRQPQIRNQQLRHLCARGGPAGQGRGWV